MSKEPSSALAIPAFISTLPTSLPIAPIVAARNRTDADAEELRGVVALMASVLSDEAAGEQADSDFHLLLAEATHNPMLWLSSEWRTTSPR